ncbi:MAG: hypothetical protein GEU80_11765 [Dehalococcoidia bacterium]|nr:hypothetical protein [Dehalococcoidia bacterium]
MTDHTKPDYVTLEFPEPPEDRPYVIVNMVMSVDGRVVVEGNEQGLGSKVDQRLMRELRVHADIVMNGAGTLRAGGTSSRLGHADLDAVRSARGATGNPIAAVISGSGDLPLDRAFFTAEDFHAVVFAGAGMSAERRAALEATPREVIDLPAQDSVRWMLRHMRREMDARLLLVEGGPHLNGELFDAGAVDEYFTSLGPVVVGGRPTLTAVMGTHAPSLDATTQLDLVSAVPNPATGEVYLRYRRRGRSR